MKELQGAAFYILFLFTCSIMEECRDEGRTEGKTEIAASLIKDGMYPLPRIAELTGLSLQAVDQLHQKIITE